METLTDRLKVRLQLVEHSIDLLKTVQVDDPQSRWYRGFIDPLRLVAEPWRAADVVDTMAAAWSEPASRYYLDGDIERRMHWALDYILDNQYPNGTVDAYFVGDMQAAPNVAFMARTLCRTFRCLANLPAETQTRVQPFQEKLQRFLIGAGQAIIHRRVYTSNHRWVASDAALQINALFPDHALVERANYYLSQGIDINSDGMYSERSTSYGMLTNSTLLSIGELTGEDRFFAYVRRNLEFVLHLVQPNGEDAYQFSRRQDAVTPGTSVGGEDVWRYMAFKDGDGRFAAMADNLERRLTQDRVLETIRRERQSWTPVIPDEKCSFASLKASLLNHIAGRGSLLSEWSRIDIGGIKRQPLPQTFQVHYPESRLVRWRDGEMAATVMGMQPNFLSLHAGGVVLEGLRVQYMYHNWKSLVPASFTRDGDCYVICGSHQDNPSGPKFPEEDENLAFEVRLVPSGLATWQVSVTSRGQKMVPIQIEFAVRPQGVYISGGQEKELAPGQYIFGRGDFSITNQGCRLSVKGAPACEHRYVMERDAWLGNIPFTRVFVTTFSPSTVTFSITAEVGAD